MYCLVPHLRGKIFNISPLSSELCALHRRFHQIEEVPFYSYLVESGFNEC